MPSFSHIACFKYSNGLTVLGNFKKDVDSKATDAAVKKCAELAFHNGFKLFTLGNNGLCYSGKDANQRYYTKGGTKASKCKNGIGLRGAMVAYTFGKELKVSNEIYKKSLV